MEELITRITGATGLAPEKAQTAVAMILAFLVKEGPQEEVQQLLAAMPGAQEAVGQSQDGGPGATGGGLMGMMGGGGVMALGSKLMAEGVSMGQIQTLGRELFAYGRESAGEDVMGAIVGGIPGLNQFV